MNTSPFSAEVWRLALEKYASVTRLTVLLFDRIGEMVCGPIGRSALFEAFAPAASDPGLFAECAQRCLGGVTGAAWLALHDRWIRGEGRRHVFGAR